MTVPGVRYVVDTGFVKARAYSGKAAAECLQVVPVSQAQARQRAGRAGAALPSFTLSLQMRAMCSCSVYWFCGVCLIDYVLMGCYAIAANAPHAFRWYLPCNDTAASCV